MSDNSIILPSDSTFGNFINYLVQTGFSNLPPRRLYRYRPPKHMVDELSLRVIHYSPVSKLSDPFDCMISSRRILQKLDLMESDDDSFLDYIIDETDKDIRDHINVCCFSESYDSFSMWDRFADGHRGVCIEYDTDRLKELSLTPFKVNYSKIPFKKFNESADDVVEYLLDHLGGCVLTKNIEYKSEMEWRLLNPSDSDVAIGDAISRVYIGCKCSKGKNSVLKECKKHGIEVIKMEPDEMSYSLIKKPVIFH